MRTLWIFIAAIVIAGAIVFALSRPPTPLVNPMAPTTELQVTASDLARELADSADARTTPEPVPADPTPTPEPTSESTPEPEAPASASITAGLDVEIPHATVIPGKIERISENELAMDDEFTLQGEGTEDSPFEPSWEYLFSAADTYQPRLGENEIPQRIALLDGKWVRVAGFTAFPLVSGETSEMLVMLNKWDGCCIGVPPTPFDAVEVRLNAPVSRGPKHQISFGTVTGRMKVDPYLIEDWLVGLYILEESTLSSDL